MSVEDSKQRTGEAKKNKVVVKQTIKTVSGRLLLLTIKMMREWSAENREAI